MSTISMHLCVCVDACLYIHRYESMRVHTSYSGILFNGIPESQTPLPIHT